MIKEFVEAMISCKMKHTAFCAIFAAVALVGSTAAAVGNPVWKQDFPDPTIWRAPDGSYRATSTALTILKSDDFRNWESTQKRVFTRDEEKRIRKE